MNATNNQFSSEVIKRLEYYVYRLIDPRNGETFYIGKGNGNRVFEHAKGELTKGDEITEKLSRIREINLSGFEVAHIIHRHGMNSKTAFEVEAALIDAYPGLTNIMGGHGNSDYGAMHADEIIKKYTAPYADFESHKILLISVNRSALETSLYEATRYAWKLDVNRAKKAEYIFSTIQGLIVGVFIANQWLKANEINFPGRQTIAGRYGFIGDKAEKQIQEKFMRKRIPDEYRKKGASNPIKYSYK
jgi:hypothetical protein